MIDILWHKDAVGIWHAGGVGCNPKTRLCPIVYEVRVSEEVLPVGAYPCSACVRALVERAASATTRLAEADRLLAWCVGAVTAAIGCDELNDDEEDTLDAIDHYEQICDHLGQVPDIEVTSQRAKIERKREEDDRWFAQMAAQPAVITKTRP